MKAEYSSPPPWPNHRFAGLRRSPEKRCLDNYTGHALPDELIAFKAISKKANELGIKLKSVPESTRNVLYLSNHTFVGIGLLKLPPESKDPEQKICIEKLNELNYFALEQISNFKDSPMNHNFYLNLCKDGVKDGVLYPMPTD